ncbi:thiamine pyrophosphate-dependent enzyme, partial [Clostridioides difficile]|uniref:thiamine pyrophosphate-dependent enzyme n=1 Tax=Clostridioides difficile TaxID=1496 RepID=UPI001EEDF817
KCRRGEGPVLIELRTYRWLGQSKSDANVYRTKVEIESWKAKDPIDFLQNYLIENNLSNEDE